MLPLHIDYLEGHCPVQAEGTIDGKPFYFRARGNHWSIGIGGDDVVLNPDWHYDEAYGEQPFAAGYMSTEEARDFIDKAILLYAERVQS